METNNEHIINDETRLENDEQKETGNNPVSENESAKAKSDKGKLRSAAAGAAGGAAVMAGAMAAMAFKEPDEPVENPDPEPATQAHTASQPAHFNGAEVLVAHNVSDDLSFGAAFAAARQEVGPGGVFPWHGHTYGTYYANEWQKLSDEHRQEFSAYPYNVEPAAQSHESFADDLPINDSPADDPIEPAISDEDFFANLLNIYDDPFEDTGFADDLPINDSPADSIEPANPDEDFPVNLADINDPFENAGDIAMVDEPVVIDEQDVTLVSADIDEYDVVAVEADFDGDYNITVVDDSNNFDIAIADDSGNQDVDIADSIDDFNNHADVSDFA